MATEQAIDEAKVEEFLELAIGDFSGTMTFALCHVGDRLGLFKDLAENGPATPAELAQRAGINERYAAEWLRGLTAPGYLGYDGGVGPLRAFARARDGARGRGQSGIPRRRLPDVRRHAATPRQRHSLLQGGRGAGQDKYGDDWWAGIGRFTGGWIDNFLMQEWIPAMPDVKAKLEAGCDFADVGCGSGRALINLAREFPESRFAGYDIFETQVQRCRANVEEAGLADRIEVELGDAGEGLTRQYDVISTFDVIHDAADPLGLLKGIRKSLKPDGI
jgi:hypothetical protein